MELEGIRETINQVKMCINNIVSGLFVVIVVFNGQQQVNESMDERRRG